MNSMRLQQELQELPENISQPDKKDSILRTYDLDKIDAKIVFDALKEGDQLAVDIVEEFGEYRERISRRSSRSRSKPFCNWRRSVKSRGSSSYICRKILSQASLFANKDTQFAIASLGNDAGICGAAKLIPDSQCRRQMFRIGKESGYPLSCFLNYQY